jgi:hypothetical protein
MLPRLHRTRRSRPSSLIVSSSGALLILTGILVPSAKLIGVLRATPVALVEQLLLGATLFKGGLVLLGLSLIGLARMSVWVSSRKSERPPLDPGHRSILVLLAVVIIAASALRLYRLDSGLWLDEILTYVMYAKMPFGEIISTYNSENQNFLYTLLAHASFAIFGEGAWALRFPAVLFGLGSIAAVYVLGREVTSEREALLSSALLAFSYHHVWFSQNARGYTGLLFWTILSSWLIVRGLRGTNPRCWLLYAVTVSLGVYTHMTMLFVAIGHFIIYLGAVLTRRKEEWPRRWEGFFLGFCLAGLLTYQLHALVLPQLFGTISGTEKSVVMAWKSPLWTLLEFVKGAQISFASGMIAIAAFTLFGAGLVSFARRRPVIIQLLLIPTLIGSVITVGIGHHLWPRFFFFALGFGSLVVIRGAMALGHALTRLPTLAPTKSVQVGTALALGLILFSITSLPSAYGPKQDYLGALAFVESRKEPGDTIVTVGLATFPYKYFYKVDWEVVDSLETLNAIRSQSRRTWLLYTLPPVLQSVYPEIMASIDRDFEVVKQFPGTLREGTIVVCRSDSPPSQATSTTRARFAGATFEAKPPRSTTKG